jgi:hypothetical protein
MKEANMRRGVRLLVVLGLAGGLVTLSWVVMSRAEGHLAAVGQRAEGPAQEDDGQLSPVVQNSGAMTVYVPLAVRDFPAPPSQFGVQMHGIRDSHGLTYAVGADVHWVRFNAFYWDVIEPSDTDPSSYNWDAVDETSLRNAAENGMGVIAVVKFTPAWAQKLPGIYCGPIKEDALDDFAEFLTAVVERYSVAPYNVRYWELGNEPDVDPSLVPPHSQFGCWGDRDDEYYGGGTYAEMLKVAYPAIKAADPRAQVVLGGLLLDCDPTHPPEGRSCVSGKFMEGILMNGGGDYFDVVSFHGYPPYTGSLQLDEHHPNWEARGGMVLGKVDFLRELMARYGVDKPLLHTEGSLNCPEWSDHCNPPGDAFYEAQADYVVWLFVRNWANGLLGTTWFTLEGPGWRYVGMLDENQEPKPAYEAFDFLTTELGDAKYEGGVIRYPHLRGYGFRTSEKRIWVLWAPDEVDHTISLPADVTQVLDKYGNDRTPSGGTLTVSSPIYVELRP